MSASAVRSVALVVCVLGIAGMIVTSILNHNGAAVTFGLVTAVAVLCSMVAKAVAAEAERRMGSGSGGGSGGGSRGGSSGGSGGGPASAPASEGPPTSVAAGALAEVVEHEVQAVIAAGADEGAVRQLVGEAVRLGRALASGRSLETGSQ
jgi:hypothetical protein